jgi:hypothetical protein
VRDHVLQRPDDRLLPDHLIEVLWAVLAVQGGHAASLLNGYGPDAPSAREGLLSAASFRI